MSRRHNIVSLKTPNALSLSLSELWTLYEQAMRRRGLSPYTVKHELENFTSIMKYLPTEKDVAEFTTTDFEEVFDKMRANGLSPVTINGRIKSLRRLLQYGQQHEFIVVNHASNVEKMKEIEKPIHSLTANDAKLLLSQPDESTFTGLRNLVMMQLMLDCGIRLREMLSLTITQVDLPNRMLKDVYRKTRKISDLPMSQKMTISLDQYLQERGSVPTDALFVTVDNTQLSRRWFQDIVHNYGQSAGIRGVRVSPHTLRHTFAKFWILNGGDPFTLQHIMGHSDMSMVRRYVTLWGSEVQVKHDEFSPLMHI